jgi:hypothetical protein
MATVGQIVGRLLKGPRSWPHLPYWPPDVFALAATLVQMSGCYAMRQHALPDRRRRERTRTIADAWRTHNLSGVQQEELQSLWKSIGESRRKEVAETQGWHSQAMDLLSIADQACSGVGFAVAPQGTMTFAGLLAREFVGFLRGRTDFLPFLPDSLCRSISPTEVCVLPKTRTPQVGCSLRSYSHNLALLPPVGECRPSWIMGDIRRGVGADPRGHSPHLSLLLVPFPYHVPDGCLRGLQVRGARFFDVRQEWLRGITARNLARFLSELVERARHKNRLVDGIVLPEAALTSDLARDTAKEISRKGLGIELFVTGALESSPKGRWPRSAAHLFPYVNGKIPFYFSQAKHHRWRMDDSQAKRYGFTAALGKLPAWERIDITERECNFYVVRHGASLTSLVCEDLARLDPVQSILRAVGPNLVIALLMDGPQRPTRWSAHCAARLCDDPGSSVLTLTSMGMLRRSSSASPREIGLWAEAGAYYRPLAIRKGAHGLLVNLEFRDHEEMTSDGRSDHGKAVGVTLGSTVSVKHPSAPAWARWE